MHECLYNLYVFPNDQRTARVEPLGTAMKGIDRQLQQARQSTYIAGLSGRMMDSAAKTREKLKNDRARREQEEERDIG